MKRLICLAMVVMMILSTITVVGCGGTPDDDYAGDPTKTSITVLTDANGYGDAWLWKIKEFFETKYANVSFEEGKLGKRCNELIKCWR